MDKNYYLPIAFKLAGHYEVEKVLGEDDFEILYLVKDLHLAEQQFVLKELFLPSYCSRDEDASLYVMAKSKQVFEQTKKDIIDEIDAIRKNDDSQSPKIYGYFEENNTVYTIMEFVNDANISPYLGVKEKEENPIEVEIEKELEEEIKESKKTDNKSPKSSIFLKILILFLLIFLGLAFYWYSILQEDKQKIKERLNSNRVKVIVENNTIPHPPLEDKSDKKDVPKESVEETSSEEVKTPPKDASYIEPSEVEDLENNVSEGVPKEEIIQLDTDTFEEETFSDTSAEIIDTPIENEVRPNVSLGRRIN